jgi:ParB/RepB/Spo0J family partition protein
MPDDRLTTLPLDRIELSRTAAQVARRKRFDAAALSDLADSMRQYGVLQPIICRSTATDYELVAGERRYLAAKQAGLAQIPAVVRSLSDAAVIEVQLIENLQRADVHPMEEAEGYQQLMKQHGHPIEELHTKVGKSRSYVYGRLKLLDLCKQARNAFYDGKLSASISLLVARIPGEALQKQALDRVLGGHFRQPMSYRDASDWIQHELMLRLKDAPFPTDDVLLDDQAGPCTTCPKRTGNQPELFGDIQGADVCTDPACHKGKLVAWGERLLEAAEGRGQKVIAGPSTLH